MRLRQGIILSGFPRTNTRTHTRAPRRRTLLQYLWIVLSVCVFDYIFNNFWIDFSVVKSNNGYFSQRFSN